VIDWSKPDESYVPPGYKDVVISYFSGWNTFPHLHSRTFTQTFCLVKIVRVESDGVVVRIKTPIMFSYGNGPMQKLSLYKFMNNGYVQYYCPDVINSTMNVVDCVETGFKSGQLKSKSWLNSVPRWENLNNLIKFYL